MGKDADRIVTRDAVETVLSGYNLGSSEVTVTDDVTNDYIIVTYVATSRAYKIDKNTIYTITYDANGGTGAPAAQEKKHGSSLTLSTTEPIRTNYRFRGWSISLTATEATYAAGGTYTANESVTLYAVWQAMYTVTYDANGGSGAPASQIKYHGDPLTLQTGTPTRDNYRFLGWSTSNSATEATYQPGGSFTTNANTTLHAVWQAIYTVSYDANGGSGAPLAQTKYHGISITLSTTAPTRSNYRFLGWSTSSSATSAEYQPGGSFTTNANTTLYAVWQAMYTISYDANGGTGAPSAQTKYEGVALTLSSTSPTRTNYTFLGWSTNSGATSATYQPGGSFTTDAATTLYAIWRANTVTITFNNNNGSGGPGTQTVYYGVATALSSTAPTRTGYTFQGWGTSSTTSTVSYKGGTSYTWYSSTTLYAVWKINTYTVAYNANGGSGAPSSQTKTHGVALTLSTTKPTKHGYTFLGWSTSSSATSASYSAGGSFSTDANTTLYAVWSLKTYALGSYGAASLYPNADEDEDYTEETWLNGSTLVETAGQKLSVAFSLYKQNDHTGGYVDVYIRDSSGTRTYLGRVGTSKGWSVKWAWGETDITSPKTFTLPSSGSYYIDFYCFAIGYDIGRYFVQWTISDVSVTSN